MQRGTLVQMQLIVYLVRLVCLVYLVFLVSMVSLVSLVCLVYLVDSEMHTSKIIFFLNLKYNFI